jgi:hypothetical protein
MWEKYELGIVPYIYALLTLEWHFRNVVWRATASYIRSEFSVLKRTFKENFTELRIG